MYMDDILLREISQAEKILLYAYTYHIETGSRMVAIRTVDRRTSM